MTRSQDVTEDNKEGETEMNVWAITAVGIGMVFAILVILSEVLLWVGRFLGPKPKTAAPEQASDTSSDTDLTDAAAIVGIMRTMGHEGNINIKRID